jgi:NAD(P)-dependent dehydrogenase (short-subunit alcohol dehydrogenase family)
MSMRFSSKVAIVTGGGGDVGRATALRLAREGACVGLIGRSQDALERVAREVKEHGAQAMCLPADVSREDQITASMQRAADRFGRIDLLVNAAGVLKLGVVTERPMSDWDQVFDVNARGCLVTGRAAIPHMQAHGGAIVNVASVFAFASGKGAAVYAASKAAVVALTQAMALDHIDQGVRINAVAPGSMATSMLRSVAERGGPDQAAAVLERIGRLHPTRRLVEADEVASLVAYLLSDEARSIVGATFVVDGGRLAKLGAAD